MTTATDLLYTYTNGDFNVALYKDGTKIRTGEGRAAFPESIDVKITDWCDMGCRYCHENSTVEGKEANLSDLLTRLDGLPPGVELAIGGGHPLSHPDFELFLACLRDRGLVPNITLHQTHARQQLDGLLRMKLEGLVYGIGISVTDVKQAVTMQGPGIVWHTIAGVSDIQQLIQVRPERVLVLGYKQYGRGLSFMSSTVAESLDAWRYWIGRLMTVCHVSFDNLAIEQLNIRGWIHAGVFGERYMGDDGRFTMYYDAVTKTYAKSSTSPRHAMEQRTIPQAFGEIVLDK